MALLEAIEHRSFAVRGKAEKDGEGQKISGYAAVFEELSHDMGGWFEEIKRGAFTDSLAETRHDILALWSHDISQPLASRDDGSLKLSEDADGLAFEMLLDGDTTWEENALKAIRRGRVKKMSIGFQVLGEEWRKRVDGKPVRTLTQMELYEISPVALPAYEGTSVEARSAKRVYDDFLANEARALNEATNKAAARFRFARALNQRRRTA